MKPHCFPFQLVWTFFILARYRPFLAYLFVVLGFFSEHFHPAVWALPRNVKAATTEVLSKVFSEDHPLAVLGGAGYKLLRAVVPMCYVVLIVLDEE